MPDHKILIENLDYLSSQISTIVRTINLGILVFVWSLLFTEVPELKIEIDNNYIIIIWIAIIAIISLLFDFLQYTVAFKNTNIYLKKLEKDETIKSIQFNTHDFLNKLREYFFNLKQIVAVIAVIGLLVVLGKITI